MTRPFNSPETVVRSTGAMRGRRLTFSPRYSGFAYDASKVTPARNGWMGISKPYGGFWLSVDGAWERWCEAEEPGWLSYGTYEAEIHADARIYTIASMTDIDLLPKRVMTDREWSGLGVPIDFEAMSEVYDGVFVNLSTGDSDLSRAMYAWDCDSVLLFSADVILGLHLVDAPQS